MFGERVLVVKIESSAYRHIHMHTAPTWSNIGDVGKMEYYT